MKRMKVLVVGGGVYGCTLALDLDLRGFDVTLLEKNETLLSEASLANQYRLHRGFHYPRSPETITRTKAASLQFEARFPEAVLPNFINRYAIASEGSLVAAGDYIETMKSHGLQFKEVPIPSFLRNVDICVETEENLYSVLSLRRRLEKDLTESEVNVKLGTAFDWTQARVHDAVILCTYGANDVLLRQGGFKPKRRYRVQLVEKPIVAMPEELRMQSLVVMDGAYCSMDPIDEGQHSVVGHVSEAIHYMKENCSSVGSEVFDMLEQARASKSEVSRFESIKAAITHFMPDFEKAKLIRSLWAVRVVPGNVSATDERPTEVTRYSDRVFSVFSGKVSSCVTVASRLKAQAPDLFDQWGYEIVDQCG